MRHNYLIEHVDKNGPRRIKKRTNLQICRFEKYSDSKSSDDEKVVVGYSTPKPPRPLTDGREAFERSP